MNFSSILKRFLDITEINNRQYAQKIDYSAGATSKMLSNQVMPAPKTAHRLIQESARLFSQVLYQRSIESRMGEIFSYLYDFHSIEEVELFIQKALELSYIRTVEPDMLTEFEGYNSQTVSSMLDLLNQICIRVSFAAENNEETVDIYSTIDIFSVKRAIPFRRIRYFKKNECADVILHQLVTDIDSADQLRELFDSYDFLLELCDVRLYRVEKMPEEGMLLLPGQELITFNRISEHLRLFHFVDDLNVIIRIRSSIISEFSHCITRNAADVRELTDCLSVEDIDALTQRITWYLSGNTIGMLLQEKDVVDSKGQDAMLVKIWRLFDGILRYADRAFITPTSMDEIYRYGRARFPLMKDVEWSELNLDEYAHRLITYMEERKRDLMFFPMQLRHICAFSTGETCWIYSSRNACNDDHLIEISNCTVDLADAIEKDALYIIDATEAKALIANGVRKSILSMR